ncbi:hypothetical protein LJC23_00650 [Desulfovibrio sp. OttesenSCG-928-I05]|nr:hypothetical protein [Desulfovibrio sp. OttesenSCG-928-I05]
MSTKKNIVSVRLTDEQHAFFTEWQTKLENETGISVPLGAVLRRALEGFIEQCGRGDIQNEGQEKVQKNAWKRTPKSERQNAAPESGAEAGSKTGPELPETDTHASREESIKKYIFDYSVE